jgi:hypothetical protein
VYPTLALFFNGSVILENQTVTLEKNEDNLKYEFVCTSFNSKPDVVLKIVDANTLNPLSNGLNDRLTSNCNELNLCTKTYKIEFQFRETLFDNMSSIKCIAESANSLIELTSFIQRNVQVINSIRPGKLSLNISIRYNSI